MNPTRPRPPFRPIGDRVLVRRIDPDAVTAGGLHIPEQARRKLNRGEVLALGPDVDDDGVLVEGVEALFGSYTGDEITLDGERLLVLRADELLGVFVCARCDGARFYDPHPLATDDPLAEPDPCPDCNPNPSEEN